MERLNYASSEYLLRILQKLVSPEEGQLLIERPGEPAELAQKTGLGEETVRTRLQEFLEKGLVITTRKGIRLVRDITQLHDANLSSSEKWVDTELLDLWKEFYEVDWLPGMASVPQDSYVHYIRVLPALKAIERSRQTSVDQLLPEENITDRCLSGPRHGRVGRQGRLRRPMET